MAKWGEDPRYDADASLDPMAQLNIEAEIRRLSHMLERATVEYGDRVVDAATKEHRYKAVRARAHLMFRAENHRWTVADVEARTMVETEGEHLAHLTADAAAKATQEQCRNLRAQLDALRSLNANVRTLVQG